MKKQAYITPQMQVVILPEPLLYGNIYSNQGASANESDATDPITDKEGVSADDSDARAFDGIFDQTFWDD